jgi:hypothetical protein
MLRFHFRRDAADPNVIQRTSIAPANQSEYLAWRGQVTEHDAVECDHGD